MTTPPPLPSLHDAEWLRRPQTRALFSALNKGGHAARAVGGAVRNTVLRLPVHDVDIATTATPEQVLRLAADVGHKAIPTGIDHGTVTVIVERTPYEVTTLRTDIETFGRHARVAFTDDWAADARRRDFTINALYCEADGAIVDPLGGYPDLVDRRVRFIGDAADRIREDYLRILRFFRFSAEYAQGHLDQAGLIACRSLRDGLQQLSRERVRSEMLRLLAAPHAHLVVPHIAAEFLTSFLPGPADVALLQRVVAIEQALGRPPDALLRLGALSGAHPGGSMALKDALRLSSNEFERLARLSLPDPALEPASREQEAQAFIYRHGAQAFGDGMLIAWARSTRATDDRELALRLAMPERWHVPTLPVTGADVLALGVPSGPAVGRILSALEDWWIAAGFPADTPAISHQLTELVRNVKAPPADG